MNKVPPPKLPKTSCFERKYDWKKYFQVCVPQNDPTRNAQREVSQRREEASEEKETEEEEERRRVARRWDDRATGGAQGLGQVSAEGQRAPGGDVSTRQVRKDTLSQSLQVQTVEWGWQYWTVLGPFIWAILILYVTLYLAVQPSATLRGRPFCPLYLWQPRAQTSSVVEQAPSDGQHPPDTWPCWSLR